MLFPFPEIVIPMTQNPDVSACYIRFCAISSLLLLEPQLPTTSLRSGTFCFISVPLNILFHSKDLLTCCYLSTLQTLIHPVRPSSTGALSVELSLITPKQSETLFSGVTWRSVLNLCYSTYHIALVTTWFFSVSSTRL